jgi:hypothetical protein
MRARFQIKSVTSIVVLRPAEYPREIRTPSTARVVSLARQGAADAVDDNIHPLARSDARDAVSEALRREIDDIVKLL